MGGSRMAIGCSVPQQLGSGGTFYQIDDQTDRETGHEDATSGGLPPRLKTVGSLYIPSRAPAPYAVHGSVNGVLRGQLPAL